MYTVDIDKSKLHKDTAKVIMTHHGIVEVDKHKDTLVTHHYRGDVVLLDRNAPQPCAIQPPWPAAPVTPSPVSVEYDQEKMKRVYTKLKQAAGKGCGDVDATEILKLLEAAEM